MNFASEHSSEETAVAPELFRLEFTADFAEMFSVRAGRFSWLDPSRLVARGRFDGAELFCDLGMIRLGINALYTGLLYKDASEINISPTDTKDYSTAFKWDDFGNTYFAPRRLLTSLYGEFPGLPDKRGHLYAGLLAQFDLSEADERFHTQYLLLRHTFAYFQFDLSAAGTVELENTKDDGIKAAFAASIEGGYQLPTPITDRLSLGFTYGSGKNSGTAALFPITREAQGTVLKPSLSGIMYINTNYEARILPTLQGELGGRYFIRTDDVSFSAPYLKDDSKALGMELDAGVLWVPISDISLSLKGGVFLPKTGSAWTDDAPVYWALTLVTIIAF
jgi:hypothetical protein